MVHQHYENQWVIPDDYYRQRMVRFFTAAKRVAFVSERNRWAATCQLASDLPNASVIRNPISDPDCDPVAWPEPVTARFASVARLDASDKGQDLLFAVLAEPRWRPRDWVLRLYGDERHRTYLKDLVNYYGIADRVEFRGHVSDVRGIWHDNHLLVLPSRCEGTPITQITSGATHSPPNIARASAFSTSAAVPATGPHFSLTGGRRASQRSTFLTWRWPRRTDTSDVTSSALSKGTSGLSEMAPKGGAIHLISQSSRWIPPRSPGRPMSSWLFAGRKPWFCFYRM